MVRRQMLRHICKATSLYEGCKRLACFSRRKGVKTKNQRKDLESAPNNSAKYNMCVHVK